MKARQENVSREHEGTFEWISRENDVDDDDDENSDSNNEHVSRPEVSFLHWLENGSGTYRISGKAGSGKSMLMRYLLDAPSTRQALLRCTEADEVFMPAGFLWRGQDASLLQNSTKGMLQALLHHLLGLHPELTNTIVPNNLILVWTEDRSRNCLLTLLSMEPFSKGTCIFINGLDEIKAELASWLNY